MEIKCIHTADVHLGMEFKNASFSHSYGRKRRKEIRDTFFNILDRAKNTNADLLLIAGDLFEEDYYSIGDIKMVNGKFEELKETRIVIAAGNHDPIGKRSLYRLIKWADNVHIFYNNEVTKVEFEDINTVVWGLSWDKKEEKRNLIDDLVVGETEKTNILLIHGDILNNTSQYLPIDKNKLINSGFDYIALGHIHKHQFLNERICYPGSPEPLDFGETGTHGIVEGLISKERVNMQFVPFSIREFIIQEVEINTEMSNLETLEDIINCDSKENRNMNLYRVKLKGLRDSDIKLKPDELEELLEEHFNYIEIIDNTIPDYDLIKIETENKDNIIGLFIKEMKGKGLDNPIVKDALYYGLEVLLSEKVKL